MEVSANPHIPRVINICYRTKRLPEFVIERLRELNPNHAVRLHDDGECRSFIGDFFGGDHADCFDYIQQGPIKADFWRACLLHAEGGIYFDVDVEHEMGVDDYLEREATFMTSTSLDSGRMNPIVLMSRKGHEALKACVDQYMEMFRSRRPYGYWSWSICPMLYAALERAIGRPFGNDQEETIQSGSDRYQFANEDGRSFTRYKGIKILKNHHDSYKTVGGQTMRAFVTGSKSPAFEDGSFRIEVADHSHPDTFALSVEDGKVLIERTDQDTGWGQNLMLKIHYKSNGRRSSIAVGQSEQNRKSVEIPTWNHHGSGASSPKMLMILAGEAFRHGQHGRDRDTADSVPHQMRACRSHLRFIEMVKERHGLEVDLAVSSYRTRHQQELMAMYGNRVVASCFKSNLVGLEALVREAVAEVDLQPYKALFVSRIDLEYKDYFMGVFDPAWDRVMFPSVCWSFQGYMSGSPGWIPRVSDVMEFVPKRFFSHVKKHFFLSHSAWNDYKNSGLGNEGMGLMLDTYHDSDSAKDYNPIFRMTNRRDSQKWYSPNLKIGKDREPIRCFDYIGFPDWEQPVTRPCENENFVVAYKYDCYLREERFGLKLDAESKFVEVRRLDADEGWDVNVILMVRDKSTGEERELFVGRSDSNERSVPLDYRPGVWEDDNFSVSVRPNEFHDVFHLERDGKDRIAVTRLDAPGGWGQNLSLTVLNKRTGRKRGVRVGPSDHNRKSAELALDPARENSKIKVALCIRGAVSRIGGASTKRGEIYRSDKGYVNYRAVAKSVEEHILKPNDHMEIDAFVHSWNRDLAADLEYLYRPVASLFEDNEMYADEILARCREPKDFSGVSHALSCRRAIQLKEQYERDRGVHYDLVVLYRPDVLLWKDMQLDLYDVSQGVFVNEHPGGNGDFHFVMSSEDASLFKGLYDSPLQGNPQAMHGWIKNYVEKYMKCRVIVDGIVPGRDQEVLRPDKMRGDPIKIHKVGLETLSRYGVRGEDI